MIAQFDSRCTVCDQPIYEGDEIERDSDDCGWCHEECAE